MKKILLFVVSFSISLFASMSFAKGPKNGVEILHRPGTPAEQVMMVPGQALFGHLGHGDCIIGEDGCGEDDDDDCEDPNDEAITDEDDDDGGNCPE